MNSTETCNQGRINGVRFRANEFALTEGFDAARVNKTYRVTLSVQMQRERLNITASFNTDMHLRDFTGRAREKLNPYAREN